MRKTSVRAAIAAITLTTATVLVGCSNNDNGMSGMPMGSGSPTPSATASGSAATAHNSQDVMFAQMMIPHHQQAIEMSNIILQKTGIDPDVTKLANQIRSAQSPEISTMRQWLTSWGANPSPSPMSHGDMGGMGGMGGGMMGQADMTALKKADGDKAARLFLTGMVQHHKGAISMAKTEVNQGQSNEAKKMAASIIASQQSEIQTMNRILKRL